MGSTLGDPMIKTSHVRKLKHPYISVSPKISRGSPIISGSRIRVVDIAIEYDRLGLTPDKIIDAHPHLTLEKIHDALSYYYENRKFIDKEIAEKKEALMGIARTMSSILKESVG